MFKWAVCQYCRFGGVMGLASDRSQPGSVDSSLNLCMSSWAIQLCCCIVQNRTHMKQQINRLRKTSSWALIPVVLLTTPVASCRPIGLSQFTYSGERKDFRGGTVCSTQLTFLRHILKHHTPDLPSARSLSCELKEKRPKVWSMLIHSHFKLIREA